ncbi:SUN domain [Phytophthora cactorum]|nr:SUN domain [Phytophthora cactorum]
MERPKQVLLLLLLLALCSVRGIVTPDAPSNAEPTQDELPPGDAEASSSPQRIEEPDEPKADTELADEDVDPLLDVPSGLFEVVDADSVDNRKRQNYASLDAGATILDAAPDTKSPTNLLVPDKDRYMLTPCSNPRKWVVISLSEDVHADAIAIANYEKFSSPVKDFIVLGSVNYPTDTWLVLGNFTATHTNGEQIFQLDAQQHVRYIKFRFLSHYGSEYYCTLSQLRVFGRTFTQVISQLEKSIDAEVEALDVQAAIPAPQVSALPDSVEVSVPRIPDPTELTSQCLMEKNNTVVAIFYNESQRVEHYRSNGMCCLVDYTPEQIEAEVAASSSTNDQSHIASTDAVNTDAGEGSVQSPGSSPSGGASSTNTNTSSVPAANSNATASSSAPATSSFLSTSHGIAASSTQGLGRLESIFVRITKKIQALEVNQSVMARQLEDFHTHQWAAIKMLQANQESLNEQLREIRSMIVDLNEMLIVREVITTMKAGILCAIVLSGFIILFFLLRLLFRCVSKCKERADLREWFWRMENHESSSSDDQGRPKALDGNMAAGALRVNRKAQFGSSWDDSAIERKTLVSDMVGEGPQKFRSNSSFSSSSDVNFDDLDDHQVFGYLEDDDDSRLATPGSRSRRKRVVKRQSSLTISTPASKLFSHKRESSSGNILQASASTKDSSSDSFLELVTTAAPTSTPSDGREDQSSDLFARQLANVKESFQAKLMAREEEVSLEKMTLAKEKETLLQHQQARFTTEAELWKHEIAALTKVKLQLESENDRLNKELNGEKLQGTKHTRTCEELNLLVQEKERFEHAQVEIQELQSKLADNLHKYELQRQQLEEQVSNLLLNREDQLAQGERERQVCARQNEKEKAKLLRFVQEVRGLHICSKTKDALENIQQQASEFAVHQSDRDMALMSRKGRILQLETQLKNDRQTINQLESTLAKSTRSKYQEQKEHLEITLAVRQGLTTDLQAKRKQVAELEREVTRLNLARGKTDVKLKHSQQQMIAMQKVHARELASCQESV